MKLLTSLNWFTLQGKRIITQFILGVARSCSISNCVYTCCIKSANVFYYIYRFFICALFYEFNPSVGPFTSCFWFSVASDAKESIKSVSLPIVSFMDFVCSCILPRDSGCPISLFGVVFCFLAGYSWGWDFWFDYLRTGFRVSSDCYLRPEALFDELIWGARDTLVVTLEGFWGKIAGS